MRALPMRPLRKCASRRLSQAAHGTHALDRIEAHAQGGRLAALEIAPKGRPMAGQVFDNRHGLLVVERFACAERPLLAP